MGYSLGKMWSFSCRIWSFCAVLCAYAVGFAPSHASAQEPEVGVNLIAHKLVVTDKGETLVPAETAKPGDVIEYEATYRNRGKAAVLNVAATVPIPHGLTLLPESSRPAAQQASLDGKIFSAVPLIREVKNASGVVEKQPVPLAEYRALRWVLPELAANTETKVALRAQVQTNKGGAR